MRLLALCFLISSFFIYSCKTLQPSKETRVTDLSIPELVDLLHDSWIDQAYMQYLDSSRSPYAAANANPYIIASIDTSFSAEGDFLTITPYQYIVSEGPFPYYYRLVKGELRFHKHVYFDNIVLKSCLGDNCPKLNIIKKDGQILLEVEQAKTLGICEPCTETIRLQALKTSCLNSTNLSCQLTQLLVQKFLEGEYVLLDAQKDTLSTYIKIDKDGLMTGYAPYKRAVIWDFYSQGYDLFEADICELVPQEADPYRAGYDMGTGHIFMFKEVGNTIELSKATPNPDAEGRGDIIYYLIRKK
jgi:hypothetical protein